MFEGIRYPKSLFWKAIDRYVRYEQRGEDQRNEFLSYIQPLVWYWTVYNTKMASLAWKSDCMEDVYQHVNLSLLVHWWPAFESNPWVVGSRGIRKEDEKKVYSLSYWWCKCVHGYSRKYFRDFKTRLPRRYKKEISINDPVFIKKADDRMDRLAVLECVDRVYRSHMQLRVPHPSKHCYPCVDSVVYKVIECRVRNKYVETGELLA